MTQEQSNDALVEELAKTCCRARYGEEIGWQGFLPEAGEIAALFHAREAAAKADAERLVEALNGFVTELTSNLTNRDKMLTINHTALVRRIAIAHEALAAWEKSRDQHD